MMKKMKHINLIILSSIILLSSCNPFISNELRRKNKCNRKLEKVIEKCPELSQSDTVLIEIPKFEIDTFFNLVADTSGIDSIFSQFKEFYLDSINKNTLKHEIIRYIKANPCLVKDTLTFNFDGNKVNIWVEGNIMKYHYEKEPQKIPIEIQVVKPIELTLYEKIINKAGPYLFWLIILLIFLFILSKVVNFKS